MGVSLKPLPIQQLPSAIKANVKKDVAFSGWQQGAANVLSKDGLVKVATTPHVSINYLIGSNLIFRPVFAVLEDPKDPANWFSAGREIFHEGMALAVHATVLPMIEAGGFLVGKQLFKNEFQKALNGDILDCFKHIAQKSPEELKTLAEGNKALGKLLKHHNNDAKELFNHVKDLKNFNFEVFEAAGAVAKELGKNFAQSQPLIKGVLTVASILGSIGVLCFGVPKLNNFVMPKVLKAFGFDTSKLDHENTKNESQEDKKSNNLNSVKVSPRRPGIYAHSLAGESDELLIRKNIRAKDLPFSKSS